MWSDGCSFIYVVVINASSRLLRHSQVDSVRLLWERKDGYKKVMQVLWTAVVSSRFKKSNFLVPQD